jgi:hypothetical protein
MSRMWRPQAVHALVEHGLARHPKHAVMVLNLSPLQDPSATEAMDWALAYRACREQGMSVEDAAAAVNAHFNLIAGAEQ